MYDIGQTLGVVQSGDHLINGSEQIMTIATAGAKVAVHASRRHSISQLPINLFASVMGIAGLSLAWREAASLLGIPSLPGEMFGWTGLVIFIVLAVAYAAKLVKHPAAVHAEFTHPVIGNFFGTVAIGLLLLSAFLFRYSAGVAQGMWMVGTLLTFVLAYVVVQKFLTQPQKVETTLPPLIIPGVATLDIPVTGAAMPFDWAPEVNLFAFATGAVMALVLVVLIFQRLRHFDRLPAAARPVLLMLVAPFAVGFLAYTNLRQIDLFASVLLYFGWFLMLVLAPVVFRSENSFGVAWWAISFPLAALSIASFRYAHAAGGTVLIACAALLFAFLAVSIAILLARTLHLVLSGSLLRLERVG
jgi:tellurite resistance protein